MPVGLLVLVVLDRFLILKHAVKWFVEDSAFFKVIF